MQDHVQWDDHNGRCLLHYSLYANKMDTQQPPTQVRTADNTPGTNVVVPPQLPMMQPDALPPIISGDLPPNNDVILTYTMRDVLNGRGQGVQRHPGNVKYRTLVFVNKVSSFLGRGHPHFLATSIIVCRARRCLVSRSYAVILL